MPITLRINHLLKWDFVPISQRQWGKQVISLRVFVLFIFNASVPGIITEAS